ncbi:hypothetical protein GJ496_008538 [Pomphorhynchus laevis]|nr:hypothetical protein GJ496_008538 [Pomphorhynchus laevis]
MFTLFQSDQGSAFQSMEFKELVQNYRIIASQTLAKDLPALYSPVVTTFDLDTSQIDTHIVMQTNVHVY